MLLSVTAERWARITDVFRSALEKPAAERAEFLEKACTGDEALRRDVERLLAAEEEPTLPSPAADLLETAALDFVPGQTLAQYQVEAKIGEGGMGAVYRGYDTRLRRNVALKLLPPERCADLERKRRLLREARAASALSHPNIVTIYNDSPAIWALPWSGKTLSTIGDPQPQQSPALSPDGRRLAIASREAGALDILVYDLDGEIKTKTRIGTVALVAGQSAWTPAGDEITYVSKAAGNAHIVSKPSSGNGEPRVLAGTQLDEQAPDWSPGGKFLIYTVRSPETKSDVLYRERRQDGNLGPPEVFLKTAFNEGLPRFSPDGRFVLYMSDESGKNEIYVRDFPARKNKWQISTNGGVVPRWRRDGKEIFYIEGGKLMAASVTTQPAFSPHAPVRLFENRQLAQGGYDASPDGKRFIVAQRPSGEPPISIHVVHNWFEEFRGK